MEHARCFIERAEALGEPPEDPLLLFSVLYGFWSASLVAFNGDVTCGLAAQFLALAEKQGATIPLMVGHRLMGTSFTFAGDLLRGRAHFDKAIALYNPIEHRPLAIRFGQDLGVVILTNRSTALSCLGYPDTGRMDLERGIREAREIGQAATLMYALTMACLSYLYSRDYTAEILLLDELAVLAEEKAAMSWRVLATCARGGLFAATGKPSEAVQMLAPGITALRSAGATTWILICLPWLALAYARLGKSDKAGDCMSEALSLIEASNQRQTEAEVHRLAGEILLTSATPDEKKAEEHFDHALTVARKQQAKSWELRAAMSMARLWRSQGKSQQARELLAPVYGWFTEGFDTLDLKEAKALLDEPHP